MGVLLLESGSQVLLEDASALLLEDGADGPVVEGPPLTVTLLDTGHTLTIRDRHHTASPREI